MLSICQAESRDDIETAHTLFVEYQAFLDIDLSFQGFTAELEQLPGDYAPPNGRLLLAFSEGIPVGCIALRPFHGSQCEMKRLFVRPMARGLSVGRGLISRVISDAQSIGCYSEMLLDTLPSMSEALHLYYSFGFRDILPYRSNPILEAKYLALNLALA